MELNQNDPDILFFSPAEFEVGQWGIRYLKPLTEAGHDALPSMAAMPNGWIPVPEYTGVELTIRATNHGLKCERPKMLSVCCGGSVPTEGSEVICPICGCGAQWSPEDWA